VFRVEVADPRELGELVEVPDEVRPPVVEADDADLGSNVSTLSAEISGPRQVVFFPVERLAEALAHIDAALRTLAR